MPRGTFSTERTSPRIGAALPGAGRVVSALCLAMLCGWAAAETLIVHGSGSHYETAADPDRNPDLVIRQFSPEALRKLAAPIALYPDDLLALVLPAATRPQQIVEAARYLTDLETSPESAPRPDTAPDADAVPDAVPDHTWDPSIIALLNYPEVLKQMAAELSRTRDLGEAFRSQEAALLAAITSFRQEAYAAGNLKSDHRLRVDRTGTLISIRPAHPQVLYVPYYDPSQVLIRQQTRVYHFYPRPYPVYYYPYASDFPFTSRAFWGLRSWYRIGWRERHLYVSRPRVETLRYYAGQPPSQGYVYRRPAPAYYAPGTGRPSESIAANPRHPGRDLAENPRHPGRDLAVNPRHPGRSFSDHGYHGDRHRLHSRPPAAAPGSPDVGTGAVVPNRSRNAPIPYSGGSAVEHLRAKSSSTATRSADQH